MSAHFPGLVIIIPLVAAFLILIGALLDKRLAFPLTALALLGSMLSAIGLLARPIAPEWSAHNRSAVAMMVIGGIILVLLPTLAAAIVGP